MTNDTAVASGLTNAVSLACAAGAAGGAYVAFKWYEMHCKRQIVREGIDALVLIARLVHGTAVLLCEHNPSELASTIQSPLAGLALKR